MGNELKVDTGVECIEKGDKFIEEVTKKQALRTFVLVPANKAGNVIVICKN